MVGQDRYLTDTLMTPAAAEMADVVRRTPEEAKAPESLREIGSGRYDLIIYDGVRPDAPPEANALYFGVLPPGPAYEKSKALAEPVIMDWDVSHPLMQYIRDLGTVAIRKAVTCEPPPGSTVLIEGDGGPLAFIAPRNGFADAVVAFGLIDGAEFNTNWPVRISFPLFLYNALRYLGNARDVAGGGDAHLPNMPVVLRADSTAEFLDVSGPDGKLLDRIKRTPQGAFLFNKAKSTGIYHVKWGKDSGSSFSVNLFDARESDLSTRGLAPKGSTAEEVEAAKIKIGFTPVAGTRATSTGLRDLWIYVAAAMLGVVLLEWYIYNRRVYV